MTTPINGSMTLFMNGPLEASGSMSLYMPTDPNPTGVLPLYINGPGVDGSWLGQTDQWDEYNRLTWSMWDTSVSTGIINSNITLFTSGSTTITTTGSMSLFIRPFETTGYASGDLSLYLPGPQPMEQSLPLFVEVDPNPSGNIYLYTQGSENTITGFKYGTMPLYTSGNNIINFSGTMPLFLKVSATGDTYNSVNIFISGGGTPIDSSLNLYIQNNSISGTIPLFIAGYWSSQGTDIVHQIQNQTEARKSGSDAENSSTFIEFIDPLGDGGSESLGIDGVDTRTTRIFGGEYRPGATPVTGHINLYLHHVIGTGQALNLYENGIAWVTGITPLYTYGVSGVSGTLNLYLPPGLGTTSDSIALNIIGYF